MPTIETPGPYIDSPISGHKTAHLPPNHTLPLHNRTVPLFAQGLTPDPAVDMSGAAHTRTLNEIFVQFVHQMFISEFYGHPWGSPSLHYASVSLQPWRFANHSLGLPHAQSFLVCLSSWVYVVWIHFLLYLPVDLCFARCVFSVLFISPFSTLKHTSIWMSLNISRCLHDYICSINIFYTLFMCVYTPMPHTHCLHTYVYLFSHSPKLKQ